MKKIDPASLSLLATIIAQTGIGASTGPRTIVLNKKERVKSGITHKQPKPGKNRPAKGYDPVTKTWQK